MEDKGYVANRNACCLSNNNMEFAVAFVHWNRVLGIGYHLVDLFSVLRTSCILGTSSDFFLCAICAPLCLHCVLPACASCAVKWI